jgi:hypothetical protein
MNANQRRRAGRLMADATRHRRSRVSHGVVLMVAALAAAVAPAQAQEPGFGSWSPASELTAFNSPALDGCPFPSRDGRRLYVASTREGGFGGIDIWVAGTRQ